MKSKNIDGIITAAQRYRIAVKVIKIDSIVKKTTYPVVERKSRVLDLQKFYKILLRSARRDINFLKQIFARVLGWSNTLPKVSAMAAVFALLIAFGGGMWAVLATSRSFADHTEQPRQTTAAIALGSQGSLGPSASVPNEVLFNMTMSQLENYFKGVAESNRQVAYEELLAGRKAKLKLYLQDKKSPLSEIVDTIAELRHWKIVLAVSNSESSLGKRCYDNNCSGIGVEPGHALWREYPSKREWAKDLDRLIEKRYKDWTLEEMNGVYNQPGSRNWVLASRQILEELKERGIE